MIDQNKGKSPSAGLDGLQALTPGGGPAPVERWNPPYCGDIGLEIRADGSWFHQGRAIARPALVRLFATVLRKDADGKTYLVTPAERVDIQVADAPFLAVELRVDDVGERQAIHFRTNLDEWVGVDAAHPLRFVAEASGGLKPYVLVRGRLEARLTRSVYLDLVALADLDCEPPAVWSGGVRWPLAAGDNVSISKR